MTLISNKQIGAVRALAKKGMVTVVEIHERGGTVPTGSNDYGDNVEYTETPDSIRETVQGWLYTSAPTSPEVDAGAIITPQLWALRLPVGTRISVGDRVSIDGDEYYVAATDAVKTYAPYITCNLRRRTG